MWYTPESVFTQTIPLPAGGAGWLAFVLGAAEALDFAGFVSAAEELAGAEPEALELLDEDAGALLLAG